MTPDDKQERAKALCSTAAEESDRLADVYDRCGCSVCNVMSQLMTVLTAAYSNAYGALRGDADRHERLCEFVDNEVRDELPPSEEQP